MKKALVGGAVAGAVAAVVLHVLPDLRRYLRLRRM
ncbi:DUF6893 family small protein [Streptomyces sp. NPDC090022]